MWKNMRKQNKIDRNARWEYYDDDHDHDDDDDGDNHDDDEWKRENQRLKESVCTVFKIFIS